jgi:hypothetical protein
VALHQLPEGVGVSGPGSLHEGGVVVHVRIRR